MKKLGITYIVDDAIKIAKDCIQNGLKPILFGDHDEFLKGISQHYERKNLESFQKTVIKNTQMNK
jgi:hypothetical protein